MNFHLFLLCLLTQFGHILMEKELNGSDFVLFTVATNETDGYKRFIRSTLLHNIPVKVLGLNEKWEGGNMLGEGGGHKVNLLRKALKQITQKTKKVVMFTDAYDVIIINDASKIVTKFLSFNARIVFSAEPYCWPDRTLKPLYPDVSSGYKYLNSGGIVGYAEDLYKLIKDHPIKNKEDDQLYYTKIFLDEAKRKKYNIKLDHKAHIFQNLNGAFSDIELKLNDGEPPYIENVKMKTTPSVLHGNGPTKVRLNSLGNYLAGTWPAERPSMSPLLANEKLSPVVFVGVFIIQPTPFFDEFLTKLENLDYPKSKIHLFVYNNAPYHNEKLDTFLKKHSTTYKQISLIKPGEGISEREARNLAVERCLQKKCDYYFTVDSIAHLDRPETLKLLISGEKGVISPLLVRPYQAWSNFWGELNPEGFYSRSFDYMDIINYERRGIWNIPYMSSSYLINATLLPELTNAFTDDLLDPDMALCKTLRSKGIFMFVDNLDDLGHLIDADNYATDVKHPDFYQIISNRKDWEARYINPEYFRNFDPDRKHAMPCPDVYWFPIVTHRFCDELVDIMENYGKWSSGNNLDERLTGGYENVPTRDIHMNQVGLDTQWLHFLKYYVQPLQELVFMGYYHDPPKSLMNFVVRYRPDEQPSLRPHHDSSTYTINIALNHAGVDFQGGGCRFVRYDCKVVDTKKGWMLMHPGRLTHYHEGLYVTNGTRYIMVSFIDP